PARTPHAGQGSGGQLDGGAVFGCAVNLSTWSFEAVDGGFPPVVTNARLPPVPANTMSRGSSQVSSVRLTRHSPAVASNATTLTLSDRWLTTQASVLVRTATATGSRPTGTSSASVSPEAVTV